MSPEPIDLADPDYDGPWTGDQAAPEQDLHPAVRGMLAVRFVDRNGRTKMPTFVGPDATENAWAEFERRDALALEFDRERPRIMRWNGATWQLHHEPAPDRCVCHTGDMVPMCLGVPGESDACGACLELDPEARCLADRED